MELEISTADLGGGVAAVAVAGEVDLYTAPALKAALRETIDGGARNVLVDLSRNLHRLDDARGVDGGREAAPASGR